MPSPNAAQNDWIRQTLGVDIAALAGGDVESGKDAAPEVEDEPELVKWPFSRKKTKGSRSKKSGGDTPVPKDKELAERLKNLVEKLKALDKLGLDTAQMEANGADLARAGVKAEQIDEKDAREKAVGRVKDRIDEALDHAKALADSFAKIMKDKKGKPSGKQKSEIYKTAIEDFYDIKVTVPEGMDNTHLDRVFDMFGSVPKEHVKHSKLTDLKYFKDKYKGGGAYNSGECAIKMGDFGRAKKKEDYEIDGEVLPVNSFNVTTLHEVGHAIDAKKGIMKNHRGKAGCGGWNSETLDSVTAAYVGDLKKAGGFSDKVTEAMLTDVVKAALKSGTTEQPDKIGNSDWKPIIKYLVDKCLPMRDSAQPYFSDTPVALGDRVFTESSPGYWWSYSKSARASTKVNLYQWRSPPEWFAEVYAISWLKKKKPPKAVDAAAAEYMWQE
ncbi:MAG: hypothetical protein AB7Q97_18920 [Gammaproteobacteria bacterium]